MAPSSDNELLALVQRSVPLVREPFASIATQLDCDEQFVLDRLGFLHGPAAIIREISGIFDVRAFGYAQALAAVQVDPDGLDAAGQIVSAHPGVSHCYGRGGDYNLWFTLAVSPQSTLGLCKTAEILAGRTGAKKYRLLPALRRYKLSTQFDLESSAGGVKVGGNVAGPSYPAQTARPGDCEIRAIRALQIDLPIRRDPFTALAREAGMGIDDLLVQAADFLASGWMRPYAAVLRHRAAGAAANVLVAWQAAPAQADAAGAKCAQLPSVSHCYLRPGAADWPYNLYTMIHGRNRQDCQLAIDEIEAVTGLRQRVELWTEKEYKKQRVRLFSREESDWEAAVK